MPALFVGHGSPMNAIEENEFTRGWQAAAQAIAKPKAILCVSAHWETRGVGVCSATQPETIHDFGGFPQALFDVRYPAPGDPALAQRVVALVKGLQIQATPQWGLDHGAWSVLRVMYPDADVPVVQLSLDSSKPGPFHLALARELAALRDEGVLIVGSGFLTHNLRTVSFDPNATTPAWAAEFDAWAADVLARRDVDALLDYRERAPGVRQALPTHEHFVPVIVSMGAAIDDASATARFPITGFAYGTATKRSVQLG